MSNAAVLTISDSACAGTHTDLSGPAVRDRLQQLGWLVPVLEVLPDERDLISTRLAALAGSGQVAAIFTTGGTGLAARDVTPEATRAVIEREIPGIGEQMRSHGRNSTPLAVLSRGLAGVCRGVLVVNLPGSPRGAVESLDAIIEVVPHIVQLLRGETEHATGVERRDS